MLMKSWQEKNTYDTDDKGTDWGSGGGGGGASVGLPRAHAKSQRRERMSREAGRSHAEETAGDG